MNVVYLTTLSAAVILCLLVHEQCYSKARNILFVRPVYRKSFMDHANTSLSINFIIDTVLDSR
jgi:hypothetical protein